MQEIPTIIKGKLGKLRGIIHKSENSRKGVIVLLHGYFSSTKLGPVNLYVQIARVFANLGFEFWRFDSYGVGDSDGDFVQSSYSLRLEDYITISNEALKSHDNLIYLGHSMGTNLAIHLTNGFSDHVSQVYLLSPSFGKITWFDNLFSSEQQDALRTVGMAERKGLIITNEFIEQITTESIYAEIRKVRAKLIIFYGLSNEFYSKSSVEKAIEYMNDYELYEIEKSDHNFLYNRNILIEKIEKAIG